MYREEERETLPFCKEEGIGVIPWSPLARGKLTRPVGEETLRSQTDPINNRLFNIMDENDRTIIGEVEKVAKARGVPMAHIAMAWVLSKDEITAPIVGVSKEQHLDDALGSLDVKLTAEEIAQLEGVYQPHPVLGF